MPRFVPPTACSHHLSAFLVCAVLLWLGAAREVRAEESPERSPHRVSVIGRFGHGMIGADDDDHWATSGFATGFGAGYAYDLGFIEVGGGLDVTFLSEDQWKVVAPWLALRPHLALGRAVELGADLRFGYAWQFLPHVADDDGNGRSHDHVFSGIMLALDLDVRVWLARRFALELGPECVATGGSDESDVRGFYLRDTAGVLTFGLFVRGVFAP